MLRKTALFLLSLISFSTLADDLQVGQAAPDFALKDQHNQTISLTDQKGKWVVLYFYPKDDTPGCTKEACSFRDNINRLIQQQAVILGVSLDDTESHQAFANKYNLPFSLLSDTDGAVAKQYDALMDFKLFQFAKRHSFIIDPDGKLAKIYRDVDPKEHVREVMADLSQLQKVNKN